MHTKLNVQIPNYVVADCFEDVKFKYEIIYFPTFKPGENITPEKLDGDHPIRKREEMEERLSK